MFVAAGAALVVVAAGEAVALRRMHGAGEVLRAADRNARVAPSRRITGDILRPRTTSR
jgi:hypothetical protein